MNKDITTKMLLEYPDVFADIENVCLFGGKPVIKPDDLELCPQEIVYKETDGHMVRVSARTVSRYTAPAVAAGSSSSWMPLRAEPVAVRTAL